MYNISFRALCCCTITVRMVHILWKYEFFELQWDRLICGNNAELSITGHYTRHVVCIRIVINILYNCTSERTYIHHCS